jgi:hypothetical protein
MAKSLVDAGWEETVTGLHLVYRRTGLGINDLLAKTTYLFHVASNAHMASHYPNHAAQNNNHPPTLRQFVSDLLPPETLNAMEEELGSAGNLLVMHHSYGFQNTYEYDAA